MSACSVEGLAWRAVRGAAPQAADRLQLLPGTGIMGDVHADARSPRQLLLVGASVYDALALPAHALRENLLLHIDTSRLASGTVLHIGAEAKLRVMFQCEACGQLDTIAPRLAARIGSLRGVLARVLAGGVIHAGDPVQCLGVRAPIWSDDWRERVKLVLDAMPLNAVVEYRDLARFAGIQSSYCRAFPRLLAKLGAGYAARAVPAQSPVACQGWQGESLFERF